MPAERPSNVKPWESHPIHEDLTLVGGREHFLMQRGLDQELPVYRSQAWKEKQKTNNLAEGLLSLVEEKEKPLMQKAIRFAKKVHRGQFREDGKTPHINHVLRVAYRTAALRQEGQDVSIEEIAVAVLHDTAEDFLPKEKNRSKAHDFFARDFLRTFSDEPNSIQIYTGIQAFNKFNVQGEKKREEEYHHVLAENGLLRIKAIDRIDSLVGDISITLTEGLTEERIARIEKSREKAERIFPILRETEPHILPHVEPVVVYAKSFQGTA